MTTPGSITPSLQSETLSATTRTAGAGVATVDAPAVAVNGTIHAESTGLAQIQKAEVGSQKSEAGLPSALNDEANMIRFIDSFWAHLNDMRRPAPSAEVHRLDPGTAKCLMDQCRIEHARLVVLAAQRGAEWLGKSRKKA